MFRVQKLPCSAYRPIMFRVPAKLVHRITSLLSRYASFSIHPVIFILRHTDDQLVKVEITSSHSRFSRMFVPFYGKV